jgi:hypothetical protein
MHTARGTPGSRRTAAVALAAGLAALVAATATGLAHHPVRAKFDPDRPLTLTGIVTLVDWRNPHVHVFINVRSGNTVVNWAIELESPIDLSHSGWNRDSVKPGDEITVDGIAARNDSPQLWGRSLVFTGTGRQVLDLRPFDPPPPLAAQPTPRWPDGQPRLGPPAGGVEGYWARPSATVLVENGVPVPMDAWGQLTNLTDAPRVAPLQPWALALYQDRQRRFLRDDPVYLNCKPTGGPRQFQDRFGLQLVEDRQNQRIFVLVGGGDNNYRIIYLDGRAHVGQVQGDDDNPLYYGRSVGKWEGDTLGLDTRGFNEDFWFSNGGLPHTEQLRLIERLSRPDLDTLRYEVTVEDPGAYTRSWTTAWTLRWIAGQEMPRHLCQENRP